MGSRYRHHRSLLDSYCEQLGLLLERRFTENALTAAKKKAEDAAELAQDAMRKAQQADRAKTQFLGTITHELRTPLNAIIGFSELLYTARYQNVDGSDYARHIHESGTSLLTMLNGVLDLTRIEAGKITLDEQEVALTEILAAAINTVRTAAEKKSVMIACNAKEFVVHVDPLKLIRALVNLLSNAIKFTTNRGSVIVDAGLTVYNNLFIRVRDTGRGISQTDIDRVLQPFGQVEDHLTRQNGGLGLGLPIAFALVRMHGGDMNLSSEVGVGTTVEIQIPAARVQPVNATKVA